MELVQVHLGIGSKIEGSVQHIPDDEEIISGEKDGKGQGTWGVTGQPKVSREAVTAVPAMWTVADSNYRAAPRSRSAGGTLFWHAGRQAR